MRTRILDSQETFQQFSGRGWGGIFFYFFLQIEIFITVGPWVMKLYTTPPSIKTFGDLGTAEKAGLGPNSARRLAVCHHNSTQPRLPLVATIGPAFLIKGLF